MITTTALLLVLVVLATGVVVDRLLHHHPWGARRPGLALTAAHASALTCVASIGGITALVGHDVLEHLLVRVFHADKAALHQAYAPGRTGDVAWNLVLALPVTIVAAVAVAAVTSWLSARRTRDGLASLAVGSVRRHDLGGVDLLVLDHPTAAAQCVRGPGGRGFVVVTTSAQSSLTDAEMTAVLAHEQAHLRLNHHRSVTVATGLARLLAPVGLLRRYPNTVARLVELEADDVAASRVGGRVVAAALLHLSTSPGERGSAAALAFTGSDAAHRIRRLLEQMPAPRHGSGHHVRSRCWRAAVLLSAATVPVLVVLWPGLALVGSAHG